MRAPGLNRSVTSLFAAAGLILVCSTARAEGPSQPEASRRTQFVLGLDATYGMHGGSHFDGHHGYIFEDSPITSRVAHLPKLSAGFGQRTSVGVLFKQLFTDMSARVTANIDWSIHHAESYNAGNALYAHHAATLMNASLELRAIMDILSLPIKPYVALAPGYGWLSLPSGITVINPTTRDTTWTDVTLRGFTFEASVGAAYQFTDFVSAGAGVGYHLRGYSSSSAGKLAGMGLSPGLDCSLGVVLYH